MKAFSIVIFLTIGVLIYFTAQESAFNTNKNVMNGVSLVNPGKPIDSAQMAEVKRLNAEWVAIIPMAFSRNNEPAVHFNRDWQWWGERLDGTALLIALARKNQFQVMLKPHVWLRSKWIGDFDLDSEQKWLEWEQNYSNYILAYARLADSMNVELFCIGTELRVPSIQRPDFWKELIHEIRGLYSGKLTYAANWDDYHQVPFWEQLDYIGVDGYFPIALDSIPTMEDLQKGWKPVIDELRAFSGQHSRRILFTEYGYRSAVGGAGNHWEINRSNAIVNVDVQANAYQCLYEALWDEEWFAGGFLWKWHFKDNAGGPYDGNWTPQGKPAEEVIARWYK